MHWYCKHLISSVTIQCRQECEAFKDLCRVWVLGDKSSDSNPVLVSHRGTRLFGNPRALLWTGKLPEEHSIRVGTEQVTQWNEEVERQLQMNKQVSESSTSDYTCTEQYPDKNPGISVLRNNSLREIWLRKTILEHVCSALKNLRSKAYLMLHNNKVQLMITYERFSSTKKYWSLI